MSCGATTSRGSACTRGAGWGTEHPGVGACRTHEQTAGENGGVRLASRSRSVMGAPLQISPADAILECIRIAAGEVAYASERIAELEAADAVGPVRRSMVRKSDEKGTVQEQRLDPPALHKWIVIRQQAMDRLTSYSQLALALKLAIPERPKDAIDELKQQRARRRERTRRAATADLPRTDLL